MHVPIVFDHPERYQREGFYVQKNVLNTLVNSNNDYDINSSREFLNEIANSANQSSNLISEAWAKYTRKVDYGIDAVDLDKIAALIEADLPTRLYYTAFRDNAFDTHVHQNNLHTRLLTYASDAIRGFISDLERMGRADALVRHPRCRGRRDRTPHRGQGFGCVLHRPDRPRLLRQPLAQSATPRLCYPLHCRGNLALPM